MTTVAQASSLIPPDIAAINLTPIIARLLSPEAGKKAFTPNEATLAEAWYRRFLTLIAKHPSRNLVPTQLIDEVWHLHILHTEQYADDCAKIFGHFVHHNPTISATPEEQAELARCFAATDALFVAEFGESCRKTVLGGAAQTCTKAATCEKTGPVANATCDTRLMAGTSATCDRKL